MQRGDVHLIPMTFSHPDGMKETKDKFVVLLRGGVGTEAEYEVPFVIASTLRPPGRPARVHEVVLGTADGFAHDTVIDCRWVHTLPKPTFSSATKRPIGLAPAVLRQISVALLAGLQFGQA
jgi:hypothetical protein